MSRKPIQSSKKKQGTRKSVPTTNHFNSTRCNIVQGFFLLFGFCLIFRLFYIGVLQRDKYQNLAKGQHRSIIPIAAKRGNIYDRNTNILALNEACISIGADLKKIKHRLQAAKKLAGILNQPSERIYARMQSGNSFVWLSRHIDAELAPKLKNLKIYGLRIEKDIRRRYPHQEITAHLLGYTNVDNHGIGGTELSHNDILHGRPGRKVIQRDAVGNRRADLTSLHEPAVHGRDLILTIDYILQTIATEELKNSIEKFNADQGVVIITNPQNGEILALACEPGFNPNHAGKYSNAVRRNRAITDLYEPGSTFKVVTMAGLLQENLLKRNDIIFCENGKYKVTGKVITDHGEKYAHLTMAEVLINSSNIGMVKLAKRLGKEKTYQYARAFGFGMKSGIHLQGEVSGLLKPPRKWSGYTYAAMAMGYELLTTPLQMAMTYGAIANNGLLLQPKIVAGIRKHSGHIEKNEKINTIRRVLKTKVATELSYFLEQAVEKGTGINAAINGVRIAGKTGTARKPAKNGRGYSRTEFVASFVGYFPVEYPRYLIFVMVDNPRKTYWGGTVAAPTFKNIAQRILAAQPKQIIADNQQHHSLTPDINEVSMDVHNVILPDLTSRQKIVGEEILRELNLKPHWDGDGDFIVNQVPSPGSSVAPDSKVTLELFEANSAAKRKKVPDVTGLSIRQALQQLGMAGIDAEVVGSGRVVSQLPSANTAISGKGSIKLRCQMN